MQQSRNEASSKIIPFAQYRRAFQYVAPYWKSLIAVLLLGLFSTAVGLTQPYISRLLIDKALLRKDMHTLFIIAATMVIITVVGFVLNIVSSYLYIRLSAESLFAMRLAVYEHLQKLSPRFFAEIKLGDVVSRINNDVGEVQRICSDTLLSVFSNLFFLAGSLVLMSWMSWSLTLASVALLPIGVLTLRHYQGRLVSQTADLRQRSANLGSFLIESLMGLRLTVTNSAQERERQNFREHNLSFVRSLLSMQLTSFLAGGIPGTVLTLSTAVVFLYGGSLVIDGKLTIGQLIAFMAYHLRLLSPVQSLMGLYTNLLTGGVALGRVFHLLDIPVEVQERAVTLPCPMLRESIRFEQVSFRYKPENPVLEDVSLTIPARSLCVLIGPSGAGKSTLGELLLRLYDVQAGSIAIDGIDVRNLKLAELRGKIALVEQLPYFFRASVRENLMYGNPQASFDDMRSCARKANIDAFVMSLPDGYETLIGERGATLSVGERQRLALARALLRDPEILILDEPTAALDPSAEAHITAEFADALRGRTTILITHRISLVELADVVAILHDGRIVECGSPTELLRKEGLLAEQLRLASRGSRLLAYQGTDSAESAVTSA